jgi:acetylornithine deacetylase/succinyl-diaminopimelate desuccinylase family protein
VTQYDIDETTLAGDLVDFLGEAVKRPSTYPPGDTREICAWLAGRLEAAGYAVQIPSRAENVDNVVARLGSGKPSLVFNTHIDTVGVGNRDEWKTDPFLATQKDGLVYGLGAENCKGSTAVHLWLAEEIARRSGPAKGEVIFTFVGDEENLGPDGMAFLGEAGHVDPDMLVLGAPTANALIIAERGPLWVRLETTGASAHAGAPHAGDNAVERMIRLVTHLMDTLKPRLAERRDGEMLSTMSLGQFHGGTNTNVVPSACWVEVDRRLIPSESIDGAVGEIRDILASVGEPEDTWSLAMLTGTPGFKASPDGPAVAAFCEAIKARTGQPARFINATGASDGRHFAEKRIEIINFGPGGGAGHAANESVPIREMVDAALIQLDLVNRLLGL